MPLNSEHNIPIPTPTNRFERMPSKAQRSIMMKQSRPRSPLMSYGTVQCKLQKCPDDPVLQFKLYAQIFRDATLWLVTVWLPPRLQTNPPKKWQFIKSPFSRTKMQAAKHQRKWRWLTLRIYAQPQEYNPTFFLSNCDNTLEQPASGNPLFISHVGGTEPSHKFTPKV